MCLIGPGISIPIVAKTLLDHGIQPLSIGGIIIHLVVGVLVFAICWFVFYISNLELF
jgi:hypothetical protein